jgi:hypothetical protein
MKNQSREIKEWRTRHLMIIIILINSEFGNTVEKAIRSKSRDLPAGVHDIYQNCA